MWDFGGLGGLDGLSDSGSWGGQGGFQEKANCPLSLDLNLADYLTMPLRGW